MNGKEQTVVSNNQQHKQHKQHKQQQNKNKSFVLRINQAGGVYDNLVIEPLGFGRYIYAFKDKKGIAEVEREEQDKKKIPYLTIEGVKIYFLNNKAFMSRPGFAVPSKDACERWIFDLNYKPKQPTINYFLYKPNRL